MRISLRYRFREFYRTAVYFTEFGRVRTFPIKTNKMAGLPIYGQLMTSFQFLANQNARRPLLISHPCRKGLFIRSEPKNLLKGAKHSKVSYKKSSSSLVFLEIEIKGTPQHFFMGLAQE